MIIVPTFSELYELVIDNQEHEPEMDYEYDGEDYTAFPIGMNSTLDLQIISLDLFGFNYED